MPPKDSSEDHNENTIVSSPDSLLRIASAELEAIRHDVSLTAERTLNMGQFKLFPAACAALVCNLPGNNRCIDCGSFHPQWAAVSYGALLCLKCSGRHRGLGVMTSKVKSITMDSWSHKEILAMLEGGNKQLSSFFNRHALCEGECNKYNNTLPHVGNDEDITLTRYKTKAALFYREKLAIHVTSVIESGRYKGREVARRMSQQQQRPHRKKEHLARKKQILGKVPTTTKESRVQNHISCFS